MQIELIYDKVRKVSGYGFKYNLDFYLWLMMFSKNLEIPNDFFLSLLQFSDAVAEKAVVLFLTNKQLYALYKKFNKPWVDKFSNHFPYLPKAGNNKVKFWEKKYKATLIEEAVNEAAIDQYAKKSSDENIENIFDNIKLNITKALTGKHTTFFKYLIKYAAYKKDQPLLNYLFKRLLIHSFGIHSFGVDSPENIVDLDHADTSFTLFYFALFCNQVEMVNQLMQMKTWKKTYEYCQVYYFRGFEGRPLHIACFLGYQEIVALLAPMQLAPLPQGAYPLNEKNETEVCLAVKGGHIQLFPLLKQFIEIQLEKEFGQPLYLSIENEDKKTFDELIKWGFRGDWKGHSRCEFHTPLHLAAKKADTYFLEQLLKQQKININIGYCKHIYYLKEPYVQVLPLDIALESGNLEAVKLLLPKGAKLGNNRSFLHQSAVGGDVVLLRYLIDERKMKNSFFKGNRPIHIAVQFGHTEAVSFFLDRNEPIDIKNKENDTPLILAAKFRRFDVMQLLIKKKANLNQKGCDGDTVLHWLFFLDTGNENERTKCLEYGKKFIQNEARILIENDKGYTAFDMLIKLKNWDLIRLAYNVATREDALIIEKKLKNLNILLTPTNSSHPHEKQEGYEHQFFPRTSKKLKEGSDSYDSADPSQILNKSLNNSIAEKSSQNSSEEPSEENENSNSFQLNVSMTVLGLFMNILGTVSVSIALTVLAATTGGVALAVVGVIGFAVGAGFFAAGVYRICKESYEKTEENYHQAGF